MVYYYVQSTLSKVDSTSIALSYVSVLIWTISGRRLRMEWISQQAFGLQQTDADDDDELIASVSL